MKLLALALGALFLAPLGFAQDPPKHEFRGAWIATVTNLDWPKTTNVAAQQSALITMLDRFQAAGINAVFFQVRPEADALYESDIEPWSRWLTGQQGRAPEPFFDPLAFAIEEAHRRGMELHAWFNPYRSERAVGSYPIHEDHVSRRHPEWHFTTPNRNNAALPHYRQLDPGLAAVRDYVVEVIMDVVRRYDIDGVHFDDYFYPYPPYDIQNEDDATFAEHNRGFSNRAAWRRDNVDIFVEMVHDSLQAVRPEIKFGISPFGIWRSGVPSGTFGLDAYSVIYADALAWLQAQTIDYNVPQLYWAFDGGQDYGKLAPWWASVRNDRHLYPGIALYKTDSRSFSGALYSAGEAPRQVRYNRDHEGIQGSVFFRAQNLADWNSQGIRDSLRNDLYRYPALTPVMDWKDMTPPATPGGFEHEWDDEWVTLRWDATDAGQGEAEARFYAVYRVRSATEPDFAAALADPRNLLAVTGQTSIIDRPGISDDPYHYVVTSVSMNSIESGPTEAIMLEGRAVGVETAEPLAFRLAQNYPNPFSDATSIEFSLERSGHVAIRVYDLLGREVATLVDEVLSPDRYTIEFDGAGLASGTYLYVVEHDGQRLGSNQMQIVR